MHLCTVVLVTIVLVFNLPTIECSGYPRYPKPNPNPNPYPNPRVEEKYVCMKQKDYFPNTCSRGYTPVSWGLICDGTKQCPCGDDEKHCTTPAPVTCPTTPPPTTQSPPISCNPLPSNVVDGKYKLAKTSGSAVVGDIAILVCDTGFCLFPEDLDFISIKCQPEGTWSTPTPELYLCLSTGNLALSQMASQSTTNNGNSVQGVAAKAVDGIRTTAYWIGQGIGCTETQGSDTTPSWQVNLDGIHPVGSIVVTNRLHNNAPIYERFNMITIKVGVDTAETVCATFEGPADPQVSQYTFLCDTVILGNVVKIEKNTANDRILSLCEVEVYTFQKRCNGLMSNVIVS